MGSNNSRSVKFENQNPTGVIDVSDEVVQRLKSNLSKQKQESSSSSNVPMTPLTIQPETKRMETVAPPRPADSKIVYRDREPTLSALEVRKEKQLEIEKNDLYWRKRLVQLETDLNKTNSIMEKEYTAAIENVRKHFADSSSIHKIPSCHDLKTQLIACHRANPGKPLKCAEEVANFSNYVSESRIKKLISVAENQTADGHVESANIKTPFAA